ncbi:MAG TPA: hypothetical protein VHY08_09045 [Bacillota bacterium]|nr:hypothetical protein [Bacillota bacterium]
MTNIQNDLELILNISTEITGEQFGISVPLLELEILNIGSRALAVPKEGISLLFSLRFSLTREGRTIFHGPSIGQPIKLELDPLLPGKTKKMLFSPFHYDLGQTPLEAGIYNARVRVMPQTSLPFNSIFAVEFGDVCSNMVQLIVKNLNSKDEKHAIPGHEKTRP